MCATKIAVLGAGRCCGVSFVSLLCARALLSRGSASLVEASDSYFYSAMAFDRRFVSREFSAVFDNIRQNRAIVCPINKEEGLEWWLRLPKDDQPLPAQQLFRLLYAPKTDFSVFDCSGLGASDALPLAAEADKVVLVIDPLPTKLMRAENLISRLLSSAQNLCIVINKDNRGVNQKELTDFLGTRPVLNIPAFEPEAFYKAEFLGKSITEIVSAKEFAKTQDMLLRALL